jgi:hypothetical protein
MSGRSMKSTLALVAALLLSLVLALPASADSGARPFDGTVAGQVVYTPVSEAVCPTGGGNFGQVATVSSATGTVSHLGRTEMSSFHCTPSGDNFGPGTMTMVAANGDKVFIEYTGSAPFPGPDTTVIVVHIDFQIVGGTGRFAGATGGGEMTAYVMFAGFGNPVSPATWVMKGQVIGY